MYTAKLKFVEEKHISFTKSRQICPSDGQRGFKNHPAPEKKSRIGQICIFHSFLATQDETSPPLFSLPSISFLSPFPFYPFPRLFFLRLSSPPFSSYLLLPFPRSCLIPSPKI